MSRAGGAGFCLGRFKTFLILVETLSYRAMQYLHSELLTRILCQIEPDL